jgi:hypothetical protein
MQVLYLWRGATVTTDNIQQYCEYFKQELEKVDLGGESLHSRILLVTMIDALSRAAHPHLAKKNHDRIVKFIDNCVQWCDRDRVSLPQVMYKLKEANLINGSLYDYVSSTVSAWEEATILDSIVDPLFDSVITEANCDCERKIIKSSKYKELFYSHRNYLVHEYRNPGDGFVGLSQSRGAHYHQYGERWELVFPTRLFSSFCHDGLSELEKKLRDEGRDPYVAYEFGSKW